MSAHKCSADLRELADWLDQNPDVELRSTGIYAWLKRETPEGFKTAVNAMDVEPNLNDSYSACLERRFGSVLFTIIAAKRNIATKRTVMREVEEYVLGDES